MQDDVNRTKLLLDTHYHLRQASWKRTANPEVDLREVMADDVNGFTTGKHEFFNNYQEFIERVYSVFAKQVPEDVEFTFPNLQTTILGDVAIVYEPFEVKYKLNGVEKLHYTRRTIVYKWMQQKWLAVHIHSSQPSPDLLEGESWPVEALKAENEEFKRQVERRTEELNKSLLELKATQQQLIQAAKMASLGELAAGIAHEIQNPLNFVNNFSEVNIELIAELKEEIDKGNIENVKAIADNMGQNEQKINHHGKRADAIVKGMLQHSRASSGKKELTDINALGDEYLRLSYHGLMAKDKNFNASFTTSFDESIGKIEVVPQDLGRVLLNLYNNAFYSVNEKKKQLNGTFEPTVEVSTKRVDNKVEISVKDNGVGIPQKVMDKIYQPFFTTKPPGQGTGLGLSLSYDIIKAHGGEINLETKEGEGAEFIIQLPA